MIEALNRVDELLNSGVAEEQRKMHIVGNYLE